MQKSDSDILRALAWPTYLVAFLLIATPLLDLLTNVWPLRVGDPQWRYGSVGLFAGFLLTPLFGMMFALAAAVALRHRRALRVLSYLNVLTALFLILLVVFFALDVLQVRATVPDEARRVFQIGAGKAAAKHVTMAVALAWLGVAGIRGLRSVGKDWGKRSKGDEVQLVRSEGTSQQAKKPSA